MKLVILIGSIQAGNGSTRTADAVLQSARAQGVDAETVVIEPFDTFFTGDYVYFSNATTAQRQVMDAMSSADALLMIVPTYFKALPGALKNFFDIVREKSLYEHKAIGFIASNHKNQDFGARQAQLIVQGILEFFETQAVFVPEIGIINPESIDVAVAEHMVTAITRLQASYRPLASGPVQ